MADIAYAIVGECTTVKCYFVPTATRRSVGMITVPSLCSNRRITVSISFHTASRSASLIRSRNGRISGSEFRLCFMAAAKEAKHWELGTISTATSRKPERSKASKHGGIAQREHSRVFEGRRGEA
jgi:hypothetical protein